MLEKYEKTSLKQLVKKINYGESVIHVDCGDNFFKRFIPSLTGIDIMSRAADLNVALDDLETNSRFDVAICLNIMDFGNVTDIERRTAKVVSLLKPNSRIYWRCSTNYQYAKDSEVTNFYPWTIEEHIRLSDKFKFKLLECVNDNDSIYAEWSRSVTA